MHQVTVPHERAPRGLLNVELHRHHTARNAAPCKQVAGYWMQDGSQGRLDQVKIHSHNLGQLLQSGASQLYVRFGVRKSYSSARLIAQIPVPVPKSRTLAGRPKFKFCPHTASFRATRKNLWNKSSLLSSSCVPTDQRLAIQVSGEELPQHLSEWDISAVSSRRRTGHAPRTPVVTAVVAGRSCYPKISSPLGNPKPWPVEDGGARTG